MEASMLSPDRVQNSDQLSRDAADYEIVRRAIAFVSEHWRTQPEIEAIAAASGVSAGDLHHLFRRWAGITPKAFLQALTLDHARALLRDSASVLDASFEVGLSGPGRLHDLFVTHEAMSPGEWKSGGAGLTMSYGFHPSPFGTALVMATARGLAGLAFADSGEEQAALADMQSRWPRANIIEDTAAMAPLAARIFDPRLWRANRPLRVVLIGTDFEVRVWETLLKIPLAGNDLFRHRRSPGAQGRARAWARRSAEPGSLRGALPPGAGQERRHHRLSLGPHPQARHAGLGAGAAHRRALPRRQATRGRAGCVPSATSATFRAGVAARAKSPCDRPRAFPGSAGP
jgi:AraC-like DNA-binding protein